MKTTSLRRCPSCAAREIHRVRKTFRARVGTRIVTIPNLEREVCLNCKEEFFDRDANIAIDAFCFGKKQKRA